MRIRRLTSASNHLDHEAPRQRYTPATQATHQALSQDELKQLRRDVILLRGSLADLLSAAEDDVTEAEVVDTAILPFDDATAEANDRPDTPPYSEAVIEQHRVVMSHAKRLLERRPTSRIANEILQQVRGSMAHTIRHAFEAVSREASAPSPQRFDRLSRIFLSANRTAEFHPSFVSLVGSVMSHSEDFLLRVLLESRVPINGRVQSLAESIQVVLNDADEELSRRLVDRGIFLDQLA